MLFKFSRILRSFAISNTKSCYNYRCCLLKPCLEGKKKTEVPDFALQDTSSISQKKLRDSHSGFTSQLELFFAVWMVVWLEVVYKSVDSLTVNVWSWSLKYGISSWNCKNDLSVWLQTGNCRHDFYGKDKFVVPEMVVSRLLGVGGF